MKLYECNECGDQGVGYWHCRNVRLEREERTNTINRIIAGTIFIVFVSAICMCLISYWER